MNLDDGHSGTSFNRPGLNAMLDEVKAGNVGTVITKDQSRMGRDVLEVGLIKRTFDENNVRFIAAGDNLDTAKGFDIMSIFRDVFNEYYVAEVSKKIRVVKQAKAERGERVNGEYPYGYVISPDNPNLLIPDPETAAVVQKIFELYIHGLRMCDIQRYLEENKILTVGALRYQRTGKPRYQRAAAIPYIWPDKTIYDILARQEYLGHTITAKTYKVSYKVKKTKKNPDEKRYFFPNTHEPLIDKETFDLAQKRLATRNRPMLVDEIDIYSGVIFCADCNTKMYVTRGVATIKRKHSYTCGGYRNRARTGSACTSHYIRQSVVNELVLKDMRRVLNYVTEREQDFILNATEQGNSLARQALRQSRMGIDKAQIRITEIDTVFRKLYEDNALGKISDNQFQALSSGYEEEKAALMAKIDGFEKAIAEDQDRKENAIRFVQAVKKYSDIQELTYENVHELIDSILIHNLDRENGTRKIEIHYSFVGRVDSGEEATASVSRYRKEMIDVKSIAI